ncbi:glycoside hydrolase family 88 protein [Streptomyces yaizuensis]|uniref:Glycosyl hydrolase family 88 n=1 Tax=Streptomyces yaizuensis TaxID=2989713 RepID=A0ABQ5P6U8_9ACTN|nr:glycoside hydrolase family 88 protein [Streptomyces sp. YSPA8]GLF98310.1 hypothetical protein SYYSPA8_28455 [Streptomyces sp. YSPA8]
MEFTVDGGPAGTDWSVAMVESTMARHTPTSIGGWSYPVGLYLYGQYQVYQRVRDPRYLSFIRLGDLAAGIERAQDPATGRWFQVVDQGGRAGNWTETSCSSMFAFALSRAARQGYVDPRHEAAAQRGHRGVLAKISLGPDGRTDLTDISIGTNVGDYPSYVQRERRTNDFHGLGAFLIMNEQLAVR